MGMYYNRDLRKTAHETRRDETGQVALGMGRGAGTVGFPDMRRGEVAIAITTVLARASWSETPGFGGSMIEFRTQDLACAHARGQLAWDRELERQGLVRMLGDAPSLAAHLGAWQADPVGTPLGLVLSMEGADPVVEPSELDGWWADGLRILSLAHYQQSAYAYGTGSDGPLTPWGRDLLERMERRGVVLDVTHLCDRSFAEAMDRFGGNVVATHSNSRALCPGERQFADDQLRALIERDAVIGVVVNAWMLQPGFVPGESTNEGCHFSMLADHIDHICHLAGDAEHVGIGSDLDGGYGLEECPHDFDTIADLQRLPDILSQRGYTDGQTAGIMHGNWIRRLSETLPATAETAKRSPA